MHYQDLCWGWFERSGDPEAYVQYKRQNLPLEARAVGGLETGHPDIPA